MANQLISDTISTTCKFIDTAFEMPVEQEFLLADYDKAIFKIVKTNVEHSITQKYINGSNTVTYFGAILVRGNEREGIIR